MNLRSVLSRLQAAFQGGTEDRRELTTMAQGLVGLPCHARSPRYEDKPTVFVDRGLGDRHISFHINATHDLPPNESSAFLARVLAKVASFDKLPQPYKVRAHYRWRTLDDFLMETALTPCLDNITVSPMYWVIDKTELRMNNARGATREAHFECFPSYKGPFVHIRFERDDQLAKKIIRTIEPVAMITVPRPKGRKKSKTHQTVSFSFSLDGGLSIGEAEDTIEVPVQASLYLAEWEKAATTDPLPSSYAKPIADPESVLANMQAASKIFLERQHADVGAYAPPTRAETDRMFEEELRIIDAFGEGDIRWPSSEEAFEAASRLIREHYGWGAGTEWKSLMHEYTPYPNDLSAWIALTEKTYNITLDAVLPDCLKDSRLWHHQRLWYLYQAFRKSLAKDPRKSYEIYHAHYQDPVGLFSVLRETSLTRIIAKTPKPQHADLTGVILDPPKDGTGEGLWMQYEPEHSDGLSLRFSFDPKQESPFFEYYEALLAELGYTFK